MLKEISEVLAVFSKRIELLSLGNENSINILAESVYLRLLNVLFDCELVNANSLSQNAPAIDLIDPKKRLAFQVSASSTNAKIYKTLSTFIDNGLYDTVDTLKIFFTTKKEVSPGKDRLQQLLKGVPEASAFSFNPKYDILFFDDIYKLLKKYDDNEKYEKVLGILNTELSTLANIVTIIENPIYISLATDVIHMGAKIIEGLIKRRFTVYHDQPALMKLEQFKPAPRNLILSTGLSNDINRCVVLFSKHFFKEKGKILNGNTVLSGAMLSGAEIIPYSVNDISSIPSSISLNLTYEIAKVTEDEFQEVIDDIVFKFSLSTEIEDSPRQFRKFSHVIHKAYPGQPPSLLEDNKTLGVEIYEYKDANFQRSSYFLCFHHNARIEQSREFIEKKYPAILHEKHFLILFPREKNKRLSDKRMDTFKDVFNTSNIKFLENFMIQCTPPDFKTPYKPFDNIDFVEPVLMDEIGETITFNWFSEWINRENKPIVVIQGLGGVGKTTLSERLADFFVAEKPDSKVIFIESREILKELREIQENRHFLDLYEFYEALSLKNNKNRAPDNSRLDNELFRLVLDSGNLLMVIDGLDEVIANVPQFDVADFLRSIYNYSEDLGKAKVLITCRDYFWKKSILEDEHPDRGELIDLDFNVIQLQPFDETLTIKFFENLHAGNPRRIRKSLELAKTFFDNNAGDEVNKFIPFVLRVVDRMLDTSDDPFVEIDNDFNSAYLRKTCKNDNITYNVCVRENLRIGQIEVDDQIKIFLEFAISNYSSSKPRMTMDDFNQLLETLNGFYTESAKDTLKAHPLLCIDQHNTISFRYDFLAEYFKSVYVSSFILGTHKDVDDRLVKILAANARLNNGFIRDIYYRIRNYSEEVEKYFIDLMIQISLMEAEGFTPDQKRKAISGLLAIAITLKNNLSKPETALNTELIRTYFYDKKDRTIDSLSLCDFNAYDNAMKVAFDFKDLTLKNCIFDNFIYFWDCKFNENTRFVSCTFRNSPTLRSKTTELKPENFIKCSLDETLKETILNLNATTDMTKIIEKDIKNLLSFFIRGGMTQDISIKNLLAYRYKGIYMELKPLMNIMEDMHILSFPYWQNKNFDIVGIEKKYEKDIRSYFSSGLKPLIIDQLVSRIKRKRELAA